MHLINDIVADDESMLKALRDAAMVERDAIIRDRLKVTADALQVHIKALNAKPTPNLMRIVNSLWVRACHYLTICKGGPDDGGNASGLKDGAVLAA